MVLGIIDQASGLMKGDYLLKQVVPEVMDLAVLVVEVCKAIMSGVLDKPIAFCIISHLFTGSVLSYIERRLSSMKYHRRLITEGHKCRKYLISGVTAVAGKVRDREPGGSILVLKTYELVTRTLKTSILDL
jgi:hypothetical protein